MPPDKPGASRKVVARLTFTSLLTAVVVITGAITAAYVFGVMTGRGASAPAAVVEKSAQPAKAEEIPVKTDILRPQDLEYAQFLREEEKRRSPRAMPDVAAAPVERELEAKPQAAPPVEDTGQPAPPVENAPGEMADYVFQMAALREEQAADHLREQLEGRGLRTRLERSGKLFLVLALLRGDAQRAAEVAAIAAQLRLGQPLLRSRKAVR